MDIYSTFVQFFQSGGVFMYPIVIVLALGTAIALERYIYLTAARATNQRIWKQVMPLLMEGKYGQAIAVTEKSKSALSRILRYGLDRTDSKAAHRDDVEVAMEEGLMEERQMVFPRRSQSSCGRTCPCKRDSKDKTEINREKFKERIQEYCRSRGYNREDRRI